MMYASFQKEDQMNGKINFQLSKFETSVEINSQEYRAFAELNKNQIQKLRYIRFYTTLILKDMLMDQPLEAIASYYGVQLGSLQSFQTRCAIFSSVVVNLCQHLAWWNMYNLLSQYMDRINFIIQEELEELILELTEVEIDPPKARAIYEAGFSTVYHISKAKPIDIMKALQRTLVVKRQFSDDLADIFTKGCEDYGFATLARAEQIINAAKKVMKKRYLKKAREVIQQNKQDRQMQNNQNKIYNNKNYKKRQTMP